MNRIAICCQSLNGAPDSVKYIFSYNSIEKDLVSALHGGGLTGSIHFILDEIHVSELKTQNTCQ